MARRRIESEPRLKSWEELDYTLKEIAEREIEVSTITNSMNVAISDIKANAEMACKPHLDAIARLEADLKQFVEANRTDIKGKTRVLTFGSIGFRDSSKLIIRNVKLTLQSLKDRGMTQFIKSKESIDREKLKGCSDIDLASVGAVKRSGDTFWYEVDHEQIKA